ncbi:hypothetical protein ApAK_08620 [Thermoplasmatales archaeon AK]|nr:hypothetical protein [Thermoplasmatales archaeon AK]
MNDKLKYEAIFIGVVFVMLAGLAVYNIVYVTQHQDAIAQNENIAPSVSNTTILNVTGEQWAWRFQLPNMSTPAPTVYLIAGHTYTLRVVSIDVIHDLYIVGTGIQVYAVPGQVNEVTFTPVHPGTLYFECVEYCGYLHYEMRGTLTVVA